MTRADRKSGTRSPRAPPGPEEEAPPRPPGSDEDGEPDGADDDLDDQEDDDLEESAEDFEAPPAKFHVRVRGAGGPKPPATPRASGEEDPLAVPGAEKFQHYFTPHPAAPHRTRSLRFLYRGRVLTFTTDSAIFSNESLDPGTALLIENMELQPSERLLDMGCGWGAIGIAAGVALEQGQATLVDVNHRAVQRARENARANGLANVSVLQGDLFSPVGETRYDVIVSNPAYKAGREGVLKFLEEAPHHLNPGGRLLIVGKGSQGILFYQRWLEERWGTVEVLGRRSGYRVLQARSPDR